MTHTHPVRVYYEDTDLAGIVYYANYLKFIERGRSEWVRAMGIDQSRMLADQGVVFAVRRVEADYLRPARFGDDLIVTTTPRQITGARVVLDQAVTRADETLFQAVITLVCLTAQGTPGRMPQALLQAISET